jgi:hypothetical protein
MLFYAVWGGKERGSQNLHYHLEPGTNRTNQRQSKVGTSPTIWNQEPTGPTNATVR